MNEETNPYFDPKTKLAPYTEEGRRRAEDYANRFSHKYAAHLKEEHVRENVLTEASRLIDGERSESYGPPVDTYTRAARMWSVILGKPVTASQVVSCMIAVKLARNVHRHKRDNAVDGAAYFEILQRVEEAAAFMNGPNKSYGTNATNEKGGE